MAPLKPFLKWAGGKSKLVPFIQLNLPIRGSERLIEPFAGSAALSLALDFDAYLLNDANPDLISLYHTLKQEQRFFIEYAHSFFIPENNQENWFYELRSRFNNSDDVIEHSALFIYLNRHAFNDCAVTTVKAILTCRLDAINYLISQKPKWRDLFKSQAASK